MKDERNSQKDRDGGPLVLVAATLGLGLGVVGDEVRHRLPNATWVGVLLCLVVAFVLFGIAVVTRGSAER